MSARVPFVAYFQGGPADGSAQTITPTEHDGTFAWMRVPYPVGSDLTIANPVDNPADLPQIAEYERVRERWLVLDLHQALRRNMPVGTHLVAAVYRYRRDV
jgi:hypothetical protein